MVFLIALGGILIGITAAIQNLQDLHPLKTKKAGQNRLSNVEVTGLEPAATRPPDEYSTN